MTLSGAINKVAVKVHAITEPKLIVLSCQLIRKESSCEYAWVMVNPKNKVKKAQLSIKFQDEQLPTSLAKFVQSIQHRFPFKTNLIMYKNFRKHLLFERAFCCLCVSEKVCEKH